jgi:hypothetical protein
MRYECASSLIGTEINDEACISLRQFSQMSAMIAIEPHAGRMA